MSTKGIFITAVLAALFSSLLTYLLVVSSFEKSWTLENEALDQQIDDLRSEIARLGESAIISNRSVSRQQITANLDEQSDLATDDANPSESPIKIQEEPLTPSPRERITPLQRTELVTEQRKQRLINSGFSAEEVEWVLRTESDIQLQFLNEQYQQRREQAESVQSQPSLTRMQRIREQLGEDYYQKYLEANGLPTYVPISGILNGSAASNAGLLPGDRILSYDGNRVFTITELNNLTIQGDVGQSVLIEVERNQNLIQMTLPRGPIGIINRRNRY